MNLTSKWARFLALLKKEFNQIRRDRRLAVSLVVPPTLQILLFGFALNSNVTDLRLGVLDRSATPESRELISSLTKSKSFKIGGAYTDDRFLTDDLSRGSNEAALVIPYDFAERIHRGQQADVQFLLNASNANTANIGRGYFQSILGEYNTSLTSRGLGSVHSESTTMHGGGVDLQPAYLYNPGLVTTWFIVSGTLGILLILNGSLVASTAMIKEREAGTLEQLLMTPASNTEIIVAKIAPLFALLTGTLALALTLIRIVFNVPFQGSLILVVIASLLCLLCGIGIGTFVATFTQSAQQAQLLSFFVNPPVAALSGALAPIEAMPAWMVPLTYLNPVRYYGLIVRGVLLKGSELGAMWINVAALATFAAILMGLSVWRFRKQLS